MQEMTIKIGHYNWEKLHEKGGFYPDDLPSDWRLSFYANEFECAELQISLYSEEEIEVLCEDLPKDFELVLNTSAQKNCRDIEKCLQSMEVKILGCNSQFGNDIQLGQTKIIYADKDRSLKEWKLFIEQNIESIDTERLNILLDAQHISCAKASELRVMIEMMGL